jgi:hypothetical protein
VNTLLVWRLATPSADETVQWLEQMTNAVLVRTTNLGWQ